MKKAAFVLVLFSFAVLMQAQLAGPQSEIPAYNQKPPAKGEKLPPILTPSQLTAQGFTQPAQQEAYKAAAKVPAVMTQEPCYCYCDRNHGHKSLHSCFEGTHGANCGICAAEALYTYKMSKKGWTASQIRDGIIKGEFRQIDLQHPDPVN